MQLQEAHRHRQLNGQESQGLQARLSRCFFLTRDQDRWKFQLSTIVRISGSSVSLRRNSLMQHNGYMLRQRVFGWIPHVKTTLRVLNIVDAASEMHIAIQNLIVMRWGQVRNNDRYLRQIGEFQTMSDELSDVKEQLRVASPTEGCTQTTGSDTTAATDRVSAAKTTCVTTVLIATIENSNHARIYDHNNFTQNQDHR